MKNKLKNIQNHIAHNPKLKEALSRMKPQKNFWGIAGIVLFFFLPELLTYMWQDELISWSHTHSITEPIEIQRWIYTQLEEMFRAGVSGFNLLLGSLLLWWALKP